LTWTGRRLAVLAASGLFWMARSTRANGGTDASCAASLDANAGHQDAAGALTAALASCNAYCERMLERGCTEFPVSSQQVRRRIPPVRSV